MAPLLSKTSISHLLPRPSILAMPVCDRLRLGDKDLDISWGLIALGAAVIVVSLLVKRRWGEKWRVGGYKTGLVPRVVETFTFVWLRQLSGVCRCWFGVA